VRRRSCCADHLLADYRESLCDSVFIVGAEGYLESTRDRLKRAGFQEEPSPSGAVLQARRKQVKLSRFGIVETVIAISDVRPQAGPDQLRAFGAEIVRSALEGKSRIPRGFGSSLVVYPVLVTDGISDELRQFASSYTPKHWSILEFPVVVEPDTGNLVLVEKTPAWGAAYYRKTRREAQDLLAPA
jgi:hypothetical protein